MSRDDPYKPPVIRPALLKRWREYKKKWITEFYTAHKVYKDHGREVPFDPAHRWMHFRKVDPPTLDWNYESDEHGRVETARWTVGDFKLVARQKYSEDAAELDGLGKFTSRDSPSSGKLNAVWTRQPNVPKRPYPVRYPNGPEHRHGWMTGFFDRTRHGETPVENNKHSQIVLDYYDYADARDGWWLLGYSKKEADLLARRQFASQIEYLENIDQESNVYVEIKVYAATDEDEEDELADVRTYDLLSYTEEGITEVVFEHQAEALAEARRTLDRRVAAVQPALPNVSLDR